MPTVLLLLQYRFYFYSRENSEPPHIHVEWGDKLAQVLAGAREPGILQAVPGPRTDRRPSTCRGTPVRVPEGMA